MKKFLIALLTVVLTFTCIAAVACKSTVRVALHVTDDLTKVYNLVLGEDLPTDFTNGDLVFDGWYYDKEFTKPVTSTNDVAAGTGFYAKWKTADSQTPSDPTKVRLTLNLNYEGATSSYFDLDKNSTFSLPSASRDNFTFNGWYTQASGGLQWTDTMQISADTTLYAHWTANGAVGGKVTLTLNPNYTGASNDVRLLDKNSTCNLPVLTRDDYTFDGWFTLQTGGIKWTNSTPVTTDTTLYAHWTAKGPAPTPADLSEVLNKYADTSNWNFAITATLTDTDGSYEYYNEYMGDLVTDKYEDMDGNTIVDYYDMSDYEVWYCYLDDGNGTYTKYADTTNEFTDAYAYTVIIDLSTIKDYTFVQSGGKYIAQNASGVGNAVLGEYDSAWSSFEIYIASGNITKITAALSDNTEFTYEFGKYGQISITLPKAEEGGGGDGPDLPVEPSGVMDNQVYNEETFDNSNLQDKMLKTDEAIGLPSTGTYNALVIPVQFKNDNITPDQLAKLEKAFNGTSADTGWESVKSYYEKSSYGKLKVTFDIQSVFQASQTADYYSSYKQTLNVGGQDWDKDGSALLLEQALAWCVEKGVDLSKYDTNGDGCIDAVYLIYSESVDYKNADFYWAYVTWYYGETKFGAGENEADKLDAYYYLFAGFDFMDENLDKLPGVKVNAETYIHETGHLLGLDDYYDYDESKGSNQGLGGADMMDYNVGDHGAYSKIMLGWITPEIITSSQTVTISSLQSSGDCKVILIPLNFDNTYFCEYLLIDLYTADGLNAMGASMQNSILYDGAEYGVRIYHVTSWAKDPYNNSYGSYTDYNNSLSNIPLIKLVEADGQTSKSTSGSWASESDLWQTGDNFNTTFPNYMRNDGKTLNFNVTVDSVSADSATVTVTFNTAA